MLDEKEFLKKIEFFVGTVTRYGITVEILPKASGEIDRRLRKTSELAALVLNGFRESIEKAAKAEVTKIAVDTRALNLIEQAMESMAQDPFSHVPSEFRSRYREPRALYRDAIDKIRFVEATLLLELYETLESEKNMFLGELFKKLEDEITALYSSLTDRYDNLKLKLSARPLKSDELLEADARLTQCLSIDCRVMDPDDIDLLREAVCRMFKINCWSAVVSTDYKHMIQNRKLISKYTMLDVCDPLYLLSHLEERIGCGSSPADEAKKKGVTYEKFVKFPMTRGVV